MTATNFLEVVDNTMSVRRLSAKAGYSSSILAGDTILFYGSAEDQLALCAVDIPTKREKWHIATGEVGRLSAATVEDGVLYLGIAQSMPERFSHLRAIDVETGRERWRFALTASTAPEFDRGVDFCRIIERGAVEDRNCAVE